MPTSGSSSSSRIDRAEGSGTPCMVARMRSRAPAGCPKADRGIFSSRALIEAGHLMSQSVTKPRLISHAGLVMDRALPPAPLWRRRGLQIAAATAALVALGLLLWLRPSRLQEVDSPQLAPVVAGIFHDEVALRARVEPIRSVQLDASEAGRVEAVFAHDGDWVEEGTPLYQLHSPEQEQLLMQRSSEVAQQMANVSLQRSEQAASLAQNRRELAQLKYASAQADAELDRQTRLAQAGFAAAMQLEQAQRQAQLAATLVEQARKDQR